MKLGQGSAVSGQLTRLFGFVDNPVAFADADLVLIASLRNILELAFENNVAGGRLVGRGQLERGPRRVAERSDDIDGRVDVRLGEGNGCAAGHVGMGG
jgi:hypothetical protein